MSATGAGLACPDWPLCNGEAIPDLSNRLVVIEWTHRTVAATLGLLVLLLVVFSWLRYRQEVDDNGVRQHRKKIAIMATAAFVLVLVQAGLGALSVLSELKAPIVAMHLGVATIFFGHMLFTMQATFQEPKPRSGDSEEEAK